MSRGRVPIPDKTAPRFHKRCGKVTPRYKDGTCIPCHHEKVNHDAATIDRSGVRWCERCQEDTPRRKDGKCKPCAAAYERRYRLEHAEEQAARNAAWRLEHQEELAQKDAERRATPENRERARGAARQWRLDNPELSRQGTANWQAANPERSAELKRRAARRRRARKAQNGFEVYEDQDIFERDQWICHLCTEAIDPELPRSDPLGATIDHLLPISKGGADRPDNVAAAHWICNVRRNDALLEDYIVPPLNSRIEYLEHAVSFA